MYFYLIGVDYKSAPLSVRENIYRRRKEILNFLKSNYPGRVNAFFTCNRVEIYWTTEDAGEALDNISEFVRVFPEFSRYMYSRHGEYEVFRHALRLACGLESQLQGEKQILSQLEAWLQNESFVSSFRGLWQEVIPLSIMIREQTGLDRLNDNIASLIYKDIVRRAGSRAILEIIVIGTGEIAELFAKYKIPGVHLSFASYKNYIKAKSLADISGGGAHLLKDLPELILKADVVVSATSSPHYIIRKNHFKNRALRHEREIYLYDLALPRDIEPEITEIEGILLQNLDSFDVLFQVHNREKKAQIDLASDLVEGLTRERMEAAYAR